MTEGMVFLFNVIGHNHSFLSGRRMSWHSIRIFWLSLFALFLPTQALAYLENMPSASTSCDRSFVAGAQNQSTVNKGKVPLESTPATRTHYSGSRAAIVNSVRWNLSERYHGNEGDPDLLDTVAPFYPTVDTSLVLRFVQFSAQGGYQDFHPSYRLSGWKETNAMYVALNGHYSFS